MFRALFAEGAFSAAFIPMFNRKVAEKGELAAGIAFAEAALSVLFPILAVLTVVMLFAFGPRHPRVFDEEVPLDPARRWLALFALIMFALCFTPAPIELIDLVR